MKKFHKILTFHDYLTIFLPCYTPFKVTSQHLKISLFSKIKNYKPVSFINQIFESHVLHLEPDPGPTAASFDNNRPWIEPLADNPSQLICTTFHE